jgi:hypothetical protein
MNKPHLGGIFSIISGALGALMGLGILLVPLIMTIVFTTAPDDSGGGGFFIAFIWVIYAALAVYYIALGALAIVGGVFALRKVRWGWALAGAIAASLCFFYLGIAAVVFVSMSQAEFSKINPSKVTVAG